MRNKIKNILVPTDFSENSIFPLKYAAELAKLHDAKIYLLHITQTPSYYISEISHKKVQDENLINGITKIKSSSLYRLRELKENSVLKSLEVECVVNLGYNIYNEIYNFAEDIKPDIIIMGSHTTDKISKFRIGSNTERVIRSTAIPVLVINKESYPKRIKKVVFASNFEKDAFKVYPFVEKFISIFNHQIYLLYINTKSKFREYEDIRNQINEFKKKFEGNFKIIVRSSKNIDEGIVKYSKGIKADLIALGVKRRKGLSLYLTDRITEGVVNLSDIPVLAVDNPK